ncbi:hypothetical protein KP509_07G035300 [Ceratopteris richardii]|uniref:Tify domain-containing protein n=1 Tax=Ceratopteris richardii TaxID=49495 RepID=A0A8T2UFX6_CERRI|nr:hypothetical protein KP509_07G035300 [Ceratopteris richardii]
MTRETPDQLTRQDHPRPFPGRVSLEENVPSELTLFYSGTVNVYSDVPADKVDEDTERCILHSSGVYIYPRSFLGKAEG